MNQTQPLFCRNSNLLKSQHRAVILLFCFYLLSCNPNSKSTPVIASGIDTGLLGAPKGKQAPRKVSDSSSPARGIVTLDSTGQFFIGNEGGKGGKPSSAFSEIFAFSEKKRIAGEPSGMILSIGNSPVRMLMYSFNYVNGGGGACGLYSNLILDFSMMKKPLDVYAIGTEETTDGAFCSRIILAINGAKELFISPNYLVFRDKIRNMDAEGPFVKLAFKLGKKGEPDTLPAGSKLIVARNGIELFRSTLPASGLYTIGLKEIRDSNDVVTWRVEELKGKLIHHGSLAFPISGARPDLVEYEIPIAELPESAAK